jgi:NAD(P)-dependent dehydrogenase (short-subunit alcohol dehydrogenase family)
MSRTAIVTGANGGIGTHLVRRLLADGWNVAAIDLRLDQLQDACSEHPDQILALTADMREPDQLQDAVNAAIGRFGGVDALVNNAGKWTIGQFDLTSPDEWQQDIDINLVGPLRLTHMVLPHLFSRGGGRIVSVTSDSGRVGEPLVAVYSGAKAGLAGFSRSLAKEVGKRGVNVNCVSLSTTVTEAARETYNPEQLQKMVARYPMRRLGEPADAVGMIMFLLGDEATWITGQTFSVNGGYAIL